MVTPVKILLASPCGRCFDSVAPPLNLATLAAVIRAELQCVIKISDGSVGDVEREIQEFQPDIVGVSASTPQIIDAYKLIDNIRLSVKTIIGGVHASALPEEAAEHADVVVVGEGEPVIVEVIKKLLAGNCERIVHGGYVENLDALPFPAFDLLDMYYYLKFKCMLLNSLPLIRLVMSRGCKWKCPFCYNSTSHVPPRRFSPKYVAKLLKHLKDTYNVKSVWFHDDEFLSDATYIDEFIEELNAQGLRFKWACNARVTSVTDPLIKKIKKAGCVAVFIGIESVSESLKYLKCGTVTKEQVEEALRICRKNKMKVVGSFIFGSPSETLQQMRETYEWILKHRRKGLTRQSHGVLVPYPASAVFGMLRLAEVDYSRMCNSVERVYLVNSAVSREELAGFLKDKDLLSWFGNEVNLRHYWVFLTRTFRKLLWRYPREIFMMLK